MASWSTQRCLQEAREACGGLGYSHYSRLGTMLQDQDVNQTWEGDNNVLLQQTAKFMVDIGRKRMKGTKVTTQTLEWLALEPVAGRTFPAKSRDDLFNIDILVGALEHRERPLGRRGGAVGPKGGERAGELAEVGETLVALLGERALDRLLKPGRHVGPARVLRPLLARGPRPLLGAGLALAWLLGPGGGPGTGPASSTAGRRGS